jgi:membrane-bound lytic murein transglycosylase MltF
VSACRQAERPESVVLEYLRIIVDEYFNDPQIPDVDRLLFAFASYEGGSNRIDRLRSKVAAQGPRSEPQLQISSG